MDVSMPNCGINLDSRSLKHSMYHKIEYGLLSDELCSAYITEECDAKICDDVLIQLLLLWTLSIVLLLFKTSGDRN